MTTFTTFRRVLFSGLACAPLLLTGCGGDSSGPDLGARFVLLGTFTASDASHSGSVSFSIDNTTITGTVKVVSPAAATGTVAGNYTGSTGRLTGSGAGYTFIGDYDGSSVAQGTFTGPGGSTGLFAAHVSTSNARAFCGTYVALTNTAHGVFNFMVDGTTVTGLAMATYGVPSYLSGTVTASGAVHIVDIHLPLYPPQDLATGQITGTNASGTWAIGVGDPTVPGQFRSAPRPDQLTAGASTPIS